MSVLIPHRRPGPPRAPGSFTTTATLTVTGPGGPAARRDERATHRRRTGPAPAERPWEVA